MCNFLRVGWLLSLVLSPSNTDALDCRKTRWAKPRHQYLTDWGWDSTINHLTPRGYILLLWAFSKPWPWIIAQYSWSGSWLLFLLIKVKSQAWYLQYTAILRQCKTSICTMYHPVFFVFPSDFPTLGSILHSDMEILMYASEQKYTMQRVPASCSPLTASMDRWEKMTVA